MRRIIGRCLTLVSAGLLLGLANQARAQEWSPAQKEVWQNVEAYWKLAAAGNVDGFLSYFHDDYVGWENRQALPLTKAEVRTWIEHQFKTSTNVLYQIKPVAIVIHGDIAFADYYYTEVDRGADGKETTEAGTWTDILMKQGDRWVLIGDHGGKTSKD